MKYRHSIRQKVGGFSEFFEWLRDAAPSLSPTEITASLHHAGTGALAV